MYGKVERTIQEKPTCPEPVSLNKYITLLPLSYAHLLPICQALGFYLSLDRILAGMNFL
jgi:hypothetical protein